MALNALLGLGNASARKWLLSSIQHNSQKSFPQTTLPRVRYFRKLRDVSKQSNSQLSNVTAETGTSKTNNFWKAFGFTVAFSGATIVGTVIWEYENIRAKSSRVLNRIQLPRIKRTGWRGAVHNWWQSLDEGTKLFIPLCSINVLVYGAWRVPVLRSTMLRYFCCNPASNTICWPMLLSTFSHYSLFHLAANMFVLNSFCSPVVSVLGKEQFLALYLTSGVIANLASYLYTTMFALSTSSLGASGAIMGILGFACTQYPDTQLSIIFLPMYTFAAGTAIKVLMGVDAMGCIMGWRVFDHAAHLGGAAWGIFWQQWGNANIWQKREPVLTSWHSIRDPPRSQ